MQSADPDVPQRPNKCHQETKTLPLPLYPPPDCRPARKQTRTDRRAGPARDPSSSPLVLAPPFPPPRKDQPYFNDVISTKARARVEDWRGRATRKVLRRGVSELAGFTRAVTKHLLSLFAAVPRSRLPLVCYCLFFHRLFPSPSLLLRLLLLLVRCCRIFLRWPLPLRSFWYRAVSIWKLVPIVRRAGLLPASSCRDLLRLFTKR